MLGRVGSFVCALPLPCLVGCSECLSNLFGGMLDSMAVISGPPRPFRTMVGCLDVTTGSSVRVITVDPVGSTFCLHTSA